MRKGTKDKIKENQPVDSDGDLVSPNTGNKLVPGKIDIGHKKGQEWHKRKKMHEEKGSTREEVIEAENNPELYQLEPTSENRSRKYESKSVWKDCSGTRKC